MAVEALSTQTATQSWPVLRAQIARYLGALKKRWWLVLLTLSIGFGGAAWYVFQSPPAYQSTGRLMVSGQMHITEGATYSEELFNFFGTQIELMKSDEVQRRARARVEAHHPELKPEKVQLAVGQLPKASIFMFTVTGPSPLYVQEYLQACMDEYIAKKKEMLLEKTDSTASAISDQLVELEKEMAKQEQETHDFQAKNNLGFLNQEGNSAGLYLAQLNRQATDLQTEYNLLEHLDIDQTLDRQQMAGPGHADPTLLSFGPLADYQKARQQIQELTAEKQELSRYLRPKHPTIVALNEQISKGQTLLENLRTQSIETLKTRRESILLQLQNLKEVIEKQEKIAVDLSGRIAEFDKIKSKADRTKAQYERLLASLRSIDVTKKFDQDTISLLERATPAYSVRPGLHKILAAGLAGGLFLGLGIIFLIDRLDDRIRSFLEFRAHFDEMLLGQIPHEKGKGSLPLLSMNDHRHALLESFRTCRSSIIFLPVEGARPKTILLTSATPAEGKTTIASNLAVSFAFAGSRVLLVDADLRRGRLHDVFDVPGEIGFAKVLQQKISWREAVVPTAITNLSLLPRGKSIGNATEHFLGGVADLFLKEVYQEYDYIIFDSAPVMVADDTLSFAPKVDAAIVVVRFNVSSLRMSRRTIANLLQRQVNLIGVICNDVQLSDSEYGYGYTRYYEYGAKTTAREPRAKAG